MNTRPEISVIMPVYNSEKYVAEAIRSILKQTFSNFELIIINNASTDRSLEIINSYRLKDDRIILISRENKHYTPSLNEGIDLSRGAYIARMDSDDVSLPRRFELQIKHLSENKLDLCGSHIRCFGELKEINRYPLTPEEIEAYLFFGTPFAHPSVMGRAALFRELRYDPGFETCEDFDLWQRACSAGFRMGNINRILLHYRVHKAQVCQTHAIMQKRHAREVKSRHWLSYGFINQSDERAVSHILDAMETGNGDIHQIRLLMLSAIRHFNSEPADTMMFNFFEILAKMTANNHGCDTVWLDIMRSTGRNHKNLGRYLVIIILSKFRLRSTSKIFNILLKLG